MKTTEQTGRRLEPLQVLVSIAALAAVAWWASRQSAPHIPWNSRSVSILGAALGLYACSAVLRAERWHRILKHAHLDRGRAESYSLVAIGYMGNNTLPARAGELMRVTMLGGSRRAVLGTIVAERLLDLVIVGTLFLSVVVAKGLSFGPLPYVVAAGAAAAAVLAVAVRLHHLARLRAFVAPVAGATRALVSWHGIAMLLLSGVIWLLEAGVYLVAGRAIGVQLGAADALYVVSLTNLSAAVPAAPGYVGTYDAAVLLALRSLHKPALGYLLVLRFILFVPITVVGFVLFLLRRRRGRYPKP